MGFFKTILFSALLSGIVAGAVQTGLQNFLVYPLIIAAETYEGLEKSPDSKPQTKRNNPATVIHHHENDAWPLVDGANRLIFSLLTNMLLGVALGLILAAIFALRPVANWRHGILWGLGGFAAVNLAPAFGLPPELPGMPAGDLLARQIWWLTTAILTACGIALLFLSENAIWRLGGIVLVILPHIYGSPKAQNLNSKVPAVLAAEFATTSLITNLIFWAFLGILTTVTMEKFSENKRMNGA
jgi:cobalt transporter subunit CbtA